MEMEEYACEVYSFGLNVNIVVGYTYFFFCKPHLEKCKLEKCDWFVSVVCLSVRTRQRKQVG